MFRQMESNMKANGKIKRNMVTVFRYGQMVENITVSGMKILCTEEVVLYGLMEANMMVILIMVE